MSRPVAGTATTAEAVSWDPTATTVVVDGSPVRSATPPVITPTVSPGSIKGGKRSAGRSRASNASADQARRRASSSPVVDALVISVRSSPVSQYASRSGSSTAWAARSHRPLCRSAASW